MDQEEKKEGIRRMEKEIRRIAKTEELSVKIAWSKLPARHKDGKPFWPTGIRARITAGKKETNIDFDWREIRNFIPESEPDYLQKIRARIRENVRGLKREGFKK